MVKMYKDLCSYKNFVSTFKKARKGKTKKRYVKRFEKNLKENLLKSRNPCVLPHTKVCGLLGLKDAQKLEPNQY